MKDCVSLEVAKKLQKVGYKSETHFSWFPQIGFTEEKLIDGSEDEEDNDIPVYECNVISSIPENYYLGDGKEEMRPGIIPAPTATQLAEELPAYFQLDKSPTADMYWLNLEKSDSDWRVVYIEVERRKIMPKIKYEDKVFENVDIYSKTLPDTLGLMMIYLLENKLLTNS